MTQTTSPSPDVQEMVAQSDTGARSPRGIQGRILWFVPLCWSLFQLWYASPLPFIFNFAILNDTEARAIHLTFAIFLAFTAYPAMKNSPRDRIPAVDWILAFQLRISIFSILNSLNVQAHRQHSILLLLYLVWFYCLKQHDAL